MFLNPYVAGNPVGGSSAFVGRQDVLRGVERMLRTQGTTALVLFGQRRIGKTSVLRDLEQSLPNTGPYKPVFFDLQDKAAKPLDEVLQQLAQRINTQLGLSVALDEANVQQAFQSQFVPDVLQTMDADNSLVILFDEFDVLDSPDESQAGAAFFPYLRDLLSLGPRLQFIFVIGRRPEDLSSLTLSVFKGIDSERVSLLSEEDTADLVLLAVQNGSLQMPESIPEQIFALTGGHPYLTQQLCQEIWEEAHQDDPEYPPAINAADIEAAIEPALRRATNALEWLWDGLSPAQRIVAAALATEGNQPMSQERLEQRLQESGVRILVGELQDAPRVLEEWDLIEPNEDGYRFRTELLRRWIESNKPLTRVQEELDHIEPAAENLFQAAYSFYQRGDLDQAAADLRRVLTMNPNHMRGSQILSEILLTQDKTDEALAILRQLYQYNPAAARPRLVQALLAESKGVESSNKLLGLYEEILEIDPQQPEARKGRQYIWIAQISHLEANESYAEALILAKLLAAELPANHPALPDIATLERKTHLGQNYQQALGALKADNQQQAIQLLAEIISIEPSYQDATRYLHQAVTGEDIELLREKLKNAIEAQDEHKTKADAAQSQLQEERGARSQLDREVAQLQRRLGDAPPRFNFNWRLWGGLAAAAVLIALFAMSGVPAMISTAFAPPIATPSLAATPDVSHLGNEPPSSPITGTTWLDPSFDTTFVYVPEGSFMMGSDESDADGDEQPVHTVYLDGYWIMQTEVTNAQYKACVEAGVCDEPNNDEWDQDDFANYPVRHVSWYDANTFAQWIGGTLPTEAQWEKAARGTDGRIYPWGDEWDDNAANISEINDGYPDSPAPVMTYPDGVSPYGAYEMAGNVYEWTADRYDSDYYANSPSENPTGPESGTVKVLRGGSWRSAQTFVRAASRDRNLPNNWNGNLGVRVVRAASPGS